MRQLHVQSVIVFATLVLAGLPSAVAAPDECPGSYPPSDGRTPGIPVNSGAGPAPVVTAPAPMIGAPAAGSRQDTWDSDMPSPPSHIRIPLPTGSVGGSGGGDSEQDGPEVPPVEEPLPEPEPETEPVDFYGVEVTGSFVLVIDRSGSMQISDSGSSPIEEENGGILANPSRMAVVKHETIALIRALDESHSFAIVSFGANPDVQNYRALVEANAANKAKAVALVTSLVAYGGTPAYPALRVGCTQYGSELSKYFFLCDGEPNVGGSAAQILSDFPDWYAPLKQGGCTLVCIHVGNSGAAASFMQALANQNGGDYLKK